MNGLRVNNKGRMKYCLVAKSPDWAVTIFRDDDKTFHTQSLKQFIETGILSNFVMKRKDRMVSTRLLPNNKKIGNVIVKQYKGDNSELCYLPLDHLAAPEVESILYEVFRVPTNGGIPVKCTRKITGGVDFLSGLQTKGDYKVYLNTKTIEPSMVSRDLFVAPSGYSRTKSVQEVLISKIGREASGDFDEMFEIGTSKKGSRQQQQRP